MVEISPKALRFARLAAEQEPSLAHDPRFDVMRSEERDHRPGRQRYVLLSEDTADFCLQAVSALLEREDRLAALDWDGNDVLFMEAIVTSLREQLEPSQAASF